MPALIEAWFDGCMVHGGHYTPFYLHARKLLDAGLRQRVTFLWVPRTQNEECDQLSKAVLLDRGVEFKIQPMR